MTDKIKPKYGADGVGIPIDMDGETMWVNEHMLFATLIAIITYLDNAIDKSGDTIALIAEKVYDHITQSTGPVDRSGDSNEGTVEGSGTSEDS